MRGETLILRSAAPAVCCQVEAHGWMAQSPAPWHWLCNGALSVKRGQRVPQA